MSQNSDSAEITGQRNDEQLGSHEQKQTPADWLSHTKVRGPRSEDPKTPIAEDLFASRV